MARRGKRAQSRHNQFVRRSAIGHRGWGWRVWADVPGFKRPKTICVGRGSARPDMIVKKGRKTRIIEVETPSSMKADEDQRRLLRRYARRKKNTGYRTRIVR